MTMGAACMLLAGVLIIFLFSAPAASAHEVRPAISRLSFEQDHFQLAISLNLEALLAGIGDRHSDTSDSPDAALYDRLRTMHPEELRGKFHQQEPDFANRVFVRFDGALAPAALDRVEIPEVGDSGLPRYSILVLSGPVPPGATVATVRWDGRLGALVVDYSSENGDTEFSAYLSFGDESDPIPLDGVGVQAWHKVFLNYIGVGFVHIVPAGLDHILFVIGLFLLSPRLSPLLWQVSSFTVAHSVTLALGMLGILQLPPEIVEPLIAASIVYVGIENVLKTELSLWRPSVVFAFGLLHGLGFASVLAEIGLSQAWFATGLVGFNLGVELGQLTVVAACFALAGFWFRDKHWYRSVVTIPASAAVALVGGWWFVERTFL